MTSVVVHESREALEADHETRWGHVDHEVTKSGAFWPAIVREPGDRPATTVSTTSFRPGV